MRTTVRSPHDGTHTLVKADDERRARLAADRDGRAHLVVFGADADHRAALPSGSQTASSEAAAPGASAIGSVASAVSREIGICPGWGTAACANPSTHKNHLPNHAWASYLIADAVIVALRARATLLSVDGRAAAGRRGRARQPGAATGVARPRPNSKQSRSSKRRIRPLLAANCQACHGESAMAGLRVDSREGLLRGGETGPAIVPGDPEKSTLLKAVQHAEGFPRMPRGRGQARGAGHRGAGEWIRDGAVWPATATAAPAPAVAHERAITAEQRAFWAFRPLAKPEAPDVRRADWPRTDIDRFILARLEQDGLSPVGAADKLTLLRRATLDLTGLPPTPDEVDAFLKDDVARRVREGRRSAARVAAATARAWGRMWLDVARYGEDDYRSLDPMGRGFNPYPERVPLSRLGDPRVQRRPAVRPVRDGAAGRRPARRTGASAPSAGARLPRPRARGTTTTARSRSRAPTSATIASMR